MSFFKEILKAYNQHMQKCNECIYTKCNGIASTHAGDI